MRRFESNFERNVHFLSTTMHQNLGLTPDLSPLEQISLSSFYSQGCGCKALPSLFHHSTELPWQIHHLDLLTAKWLMRQAPLLSGTDPISDVWTPRQSKPRASLLFETAPPSHAVSPRALSVATWCELQHGGRTLSTHPPRASFRKLQKPVVVCLQPQSPDSPGQLKSIRSDLEKNPCGLHK